MSLSKAGNHSLCVEGLAPDFFSGALLGNGALGAVVTTRPDSVMIHLGHNAVWDIRLEELKREELLTFSEIFERIDALPPETSVQDDPWLKSYFERAGVPYSRPYPRPFPCGTILLGIDRRDTAITGHTLDIKRGRCQIDFLHDGITLHLEIFADARHDKLWIRGLDDSERPAALPFTRVRLLPDPVAGKSLPPFHGWVTEQHLGFDQPLPSKPADEHGTFPKSPNDRRVACVLRFQDGLGSKRPDTSTSIWMENSRGTEKDPLHRHFSSQAPFLACAELTHANPPVEPKIPELNGVEEAVIARDHLWTSFWSKSAVTLDDVLLEQAWYRNLYFFRCAVRPDTVCPGLYANWSYLDIGTAWHGDWHLNYNVQQPFWLTFSSNHPELHLPYVDMVDHISPVAEWTAREYFGLRGAYYPHSAYPVEMSVPPYLVPTWGWEICETPWAVQSLWWHYQFTQDLEFLRTRAYPRMRESARFLADYILRLEKTPGRWNDGRCHIFPSVVPELHGLEPGFQKNADITCDIALTRFLFRAVLEAVQILGLEETELLSDIENILPRLPAYPVAQGRKGTVFINVQGEDPDIVQNCPASTMMIFPAEEITLSSDEDTLCLARRSLQEQRNEGGNDLVHLSMQKARLGVLDLAAFKRQISYCLLPNGTCADMVLEGGGRYHDTTARGWMAKTGIWFENFSLPAVINECLMQSVGGILRLFPNWPLDKTASFENLRAVGGFLVSAECRDGGVQKLRIQSEAGSPLHLLNPWHPHPATIQKNDGAPECIPEELISLKTTPGDMLLLTKAAVPASSRLPLASLDIG